MRIFSQAGRFSPGMEPKSGPGKQYGEGYKYVSYGLTFAGGIIVFMLVGLWLDRRLGVVPLFTVAGDADRRGAQLPVGVSPAGG